MRGINADMCDHTDSFAGLIYHVWHVNYVSGRQRRARRSSDDRDVNSARQPSHVRHAVNTKAVADQLLCIIIKSAGTS